MTVAGEDDFGEGVGAGGEGFDFYSYEGEEEDLPLWNGGLL